MGPLFQTPEDARQAIENDVHAIGISTPRRRPQDPGAGHHAELERAGRRRHHRLRRRRDPAAGLRLPLYAAGVRAFTAPARLSRPAAGGDQGAAAVDVRVADAPEATPFRIEALRSLERLGRFNRTWRGAAARSSGPEWMRASVVDGERVGFTVEPQADPTHHLYVHPGAGRASAPGSSSKSSVRVRKANATLGARCESRANDFYRRHGFELVECGDLDNQYRCLEGFA